MKKLLTRQTLTSLTDTMPKRAASVLAVSAVSMAALSASVLAWGPDRPTYTVANPADHVTFNSITDNPEYGDERNFVRIKEASAPSSAFSDDTTVEPGKEYEVYVYYHNNASRTLNSEAHGQKGVARDAALRMAMPGGLKAGERTGMTGYISASNATPREVYDNSYMTATTDVALRYVPGSAVVTNGGGISGQVLPDSLFTTGALLGYDNLNGVIPGCNEFAGFVKFKFRADAPNFTIKKQVATAGTDDWKDKIVAKVGERVDYLISYQNTGSVQQDDVVVKDALPNGMSYVAGSTLVANSAAPSGAQSPDTITTDGLNLGSYAPQGTAYIKLSATVGKELEKCGPNNLVNYATIITPNGNRQATATVTVDAACAPNECKPGVPEGDARCACIPAEGQIIDADGNCVVTPVALPTTGPAETILTLFGIGAMAAGFTYWYRSRQQLKAALAGVDINSDTTAEEAPKLLKVRNEASDDTE